MEPRIASEAGIGTRRYEDPMKQPNYGTESMSQYGITATDWVLGLLALPIMLFVLMVLTSGSTTWLETPSTRRKAAVAVIAVEVALVAGLAWLVTTWPY